MASKTIENDNDRRLTIMTSTFVPCGAKLPVIALMAGVIGSEATGFPAGSLTFIMYVIGVCDSAGFRNYSEKDKTVPRRCGTACNGASDAYTALHRRQYWLHTWERTQRIYQKAGTILLLACIVMWFLRIWIYRWKLWGSRGILQTVFWHPSEV